MKKSNVNKIGPLAVALASLLFLLPLDTYQLFNKFSLLRIFALIPLLIGIILFRGLKIKRSSTLVILMFYILLILITSTFSYSLSASLARLATYSMYVILLLIVTSYPFNEREKKLLFTSFIAIAILSAALAYLAPYYFEGRLTFMINSTMAEDPNQFSGYLIPGLLFFYYQFLTQHKKKILYLLVAIFFTYLILLTGSRGGLLAAIIGLMTLSWLIYYRRTLSIVKATVVVLLVCSLTFFTAAQFINRLDPAISQRFNVEDVAKSGGSGRTGIWDKDIEIYSNSSVPRKIFGQGAGSLTSLTGRVAHNTWLETLVELGLLGVILFSALVLSIARQLYNSKQILLFSIFISYIGLTVSLSLFGYKPIWAIMILSVIYCSTSKPSQPTTNFNYSTQAKRYKASSIDRGDK